MKFDFHGQQAQLTWYSQDIVTASLDAVYGKEILCRGFISDGHLPIAMAKLTLG